MFTSQSNQIQGMALLDTLSPEQLCASLPVGPDYSKGFRVEYVGELSTPERGIMCLANSTGFSAYLTSPMDFYGSIDFEESFNALVSSGWDTMSIIEVARDLVPA